MLSKTAAVTPGSQERGGVALVQVWSELRRHYGGSCVCLDPPVTEWPCLVFTFLKLIMFSRITPRPGCECQAGSRCWGCFSLFTAQKNKPKPCNVVYSLPVFVDGYFVIDGAHITR